MKRTRAELYAQILKAARGAGLPLGVAEDLAWALGIPGRHGALVAVSEARVWAFGGASGVSGRRNRWIR